MEAFRPRWTEDKADTLLYLFYLIREHGLLDRSEIEAITKLQVIDLADWYERQYDLHKARKEVETRWLNRS